MALGGVIHLQADRTLCQSDIKLTFAGVDPGADRDRLAHLRRPFLGMRTLGSFNHPGPMKRPIAILLQTSALKAAMGCDPTIGDPARVATRAGSFLSEPSQCNDSP